MTHTCPASHCTKPVPADKLSCATHWFQLPKDIRDNVWAAYLGHGPGSGEHIEAVAAALEWYRQQP